ncbi:MAG: response regulator transcription factor, partial [Chloroflexi bacterium]|nr:response regulator transcription factor [Chloroflexota bacterium]
MTSAQRINVMVVADHSIVREGLKHVLEQSGEFEVVGQAGDGEEAVRLAAEVSPDVVVMDVMMPRKDGVEACREIMESAPETRVVMLTVADEETAVVEAVAAGAAGYLRKETDRDRLLSTVRGVSRGELRLPAEVVRGVFAAVRDVAEAGDAADAAGLTEREREILVAFAGGTSYARIAEQR